MRVNRERRRCEGHGRQSGEKCSAHKTRLFAGHASNRPSPSRVEMGDVCRQPEYESASALRIR